MNQEFHIKLTVYVDVTANDAGTAQDVARDLVPREFEIRDVEIVDEQPVECGRAE